MKHPTQREIDVVNALSNELFCGHEVIGKMRIFPFGKKMRDNMM